MIVRVLVIIFALGLPALSPALAQSRPTATTESALLAEGWASLAKGDASRAAQLASAAMAREPRSVAALSLAIDADLARGGPSAALDTYERWLAGRKADDVYALRRVARAALRDATTQGSAAAGAEALRALASDRDPGAVATLEESASAGHLRDTLVLASAGDEAAVKRLVSQLRSTPGSKSLIISALAQSGSGLAVSPLNALLADPNDVNRAAAAEALGRLGSDQSIPQLIPLLKDPVPSVRLKAAGALYRLNELSGLPLLTQLAQSEHAMVRVGAAQEMASRPDAEWERLVRTLTTDADPLVRLQAAKLIAPHDQALAETVLDGLARDSNAGIQEAAAAAVDAVTNDLAKLRSHMRSADIVVRVRAAARILELSR